MSLSQAQELILAEYNGYHLRNVAVAFIVLEVFFVGLRYVARYISRAPTGLDDIFMIPSLITNLGLCALAIALVKDGGTGHHILWLEVNELAVLPTYSKLIVAFAIAYALAVVFPKMAIVGLYLRIFVAQSYRITSFIVLGILVATGLANVITTLVECVPLSFLWDPLGHPGGHCIDIDTFWKWASFPNIITDLFILLLPLPCVWTLKLSIKDKIGLILTFCTGSVGLITSIIRFTIFFEQDSQNDPTYVATKLGSIAIVETGVYLIAACLPTYRSLFRSIRDQASLTTKGTLGSKKRTEAASTSVSGKSFGSSGFERLNNDQGDMIKDGYTIHGDNERGLIESGHYELSEQIRVKKDFVVTSSAI